jgi:type II secretory pathway pseudopilin PulG
LNTPPAQPQYPQGQPYPPQGQVYGQPPVTEGKATASLVFGILSILCFGILAGIPAIILGHISRKNIERSMGRLGGGGMAMAGLIMGYCSVLLSLLILPAIVIPNLMRARITANESAAQSTLRTINTSQETYSTTFPEKGYAPDLASLGRFQGSPCNSDHACLIDDVLGDVRCTAGNWCTKYGYQFSLSREGDCPSQEGSGTQCTYVVVATPVSISMGDRSFCSTSDGIIRYRRGVRLTQPISAERCSLWLHL